MITIPLTATSSQIGNVTLGNQSCRMSVYQKSTGLFLDLSVAGVAIVSCVICRDRVRIVRYSYLGFIGDLVFIDTHGTADPQFDGLGTRWQLAYLAPEEVSAFA